MSNFIDILEIGHPVTFPTIHNFVDITGKVYNRLTAIEYRGKKRKASYWLFQCYEKCKKLKVSRAADVKNGKIKSCGCLQSENTTKMKTKHGLRYTPEYKTYLDMYARCYNPNNKAYKYYGGRGIKISDEWLNSIETFCSEMGPKPSPKHSIERIDVNGNYCKENCRWATYKEQANNRSNNHFIEYNGETKTASQWGEIFKIHPTVITGRLKLGWSVEDALNIPVQKRVKSK